MKGHTAPCSVHWLMPCNKRLPTRACIVIISFFYSQLQGYLDCSYLVARTSNNSRLPGNLTFYGLLHAGGGGGGVFKVLRATFSVLENLKF